MLPSHTVAASFTQAMKPDSTSGRAQTNPQTPSHLSPQLATFAQAAVHSAEPVEPPLDDPPLLVAPLLDVAPDDELVDEPDELAPPSDADVVPPEPQAASVNVMNVAIAEIPRTIRRA